MPDTAIVDEPGSFATVEELACALKIGATTSRRLVDSSLERIASFDGELGAFVRTFASEARSAATACDQLRQSGRAVEPLFGIPVAVKDLFHYAGHLTEAGSKAMAGHLSTETAHCVRRLEQAGSIVLGKTSTVEFAFGGWGTNPSLGTPRNPWDLQVASRARRLVQWLGCRGCGWTRDGRPRQRHRWFDPYPGRALRHRRPEKLEGLGGPKRRPAALSNA